MTADTVPVEKRTLLWGLGLIAFGFAYVAAVNVSVPGRTFLGAPTGTSVRSGMWNPLEWFDYCEAALPPRLGVMAIGLAVLLVCGYFAERSNPLRLPHHEVLQDGDLYWCRNCSFTSHDITTARVHKQIRITPGSPASMTFSPRASVPLASGPSSLPNPPAPEFKTCPDCAEQVRAAARKCRFCGFEFNDVPSA